MPFPTFVKPVRSRVTRLRRTRQRYPRWLRRPKLNSKEDLYWRAECDAMSIITDALETKGPLVRQHLIRMLNGKAIATIYDNYSAAEQEDWNNNDFPTLAKWVRSEFEQKASRGGTVEEDDVEDAFRLLADVFYHLDMSPRQSFLTFWPGHQDKVAYRTVVEALRHCKMIRLRDWRPFEKYLPLPLYPIRVEGDENDHAPSARNCIKCSEGYKLGEKHVRVDCHKHTLHFKCRKLNYEGFWTSECPSCNREEYNQDNRLPVR